MSEAAAARCEVDDDPGRLDHAVIWEFLAHGAYWARWRSREDVERQVRGSWRVVGAYEVDSGAMVGFARSLSDGVALAYLADVFVLPAHRGSGLGHRLVEKMIDEGPGADFRWLLHTADAHALYRRFGFTSPDATLMERPGARRPATQP
jgi:GNAT superfamily N-acetyltransferase